MKLSWFAEIRHPNGETAAVLFETPAEESYREVVRRAQLECERLGVTLITLFNLNIWSIAEVPPLTISQPQTH